MLNKPNFCLLKYIKNNIKLNYFDYLEFIINYLQIKLTGLQSTCITTPGTTTLQSSVQSTPPSKNVYNFLF